MLNYKQHINESRRNKKRSRNQQRTEQRQQFNKKYVLPPLHPMGMPMVVSDRLEYILTKMSETGNKIAKELLSLIENKDKLHQISYIDITRKDDSFTYLPNGGKDLPEDQKFTSNKRQTSKIYKMIKMIFYNKYTKNEITKFVSIFKSIYHKGPEKKDSPLPLSDEQIVKKLLSDTETNKIKWTKISEASNWIKYEFVKKITDTKSLVFDYYIFIWRGYENMSFISISIKIVNELQEIFIKSIRYENIIELNRLMIEKYNIEINDQI